MLQSLSLPFPRPVGERVGAHGASATWEGEGPSGVVFHQLNALAYYSSLKDVVSSVNKSEKEIRKIQTIKVLKFSLTIHITLWLYQKHIAVVVEPES